MRAPRSVLVVVTRRIGDVLLATPLMRSVKQAWPGAAVDALVFAGSEGVLLANPDLRRVIVVPERPSVGRHLALLLQLLRRYDIALSVLPGDRPTLYAWLAGRWRAGLVLDAPEHRWKRRLLQRWVRFDEVGTHTVLMNLALADTLGIPARREVVAAWRACDRIALRSKLPFPETQPYAVLHAYPRFNYKMWHHAGWIRITRWLRARGLRVVLSGGADDAERAYVAAIARAVPGTVDLCGKLPLSEAACLIAHARVYIGPDTALTHMAAALDVPVVALYGPTDPLKWGPWPAGYTLDVNPWRSSGTQCVANVTVVQGAGTCVPCLKEGCARHRESFSDCLQQLAPDTVIAAACRRLELPIDTPSERALARSSAAQ